MSGASEQANGYANDPVLQSVFFVVLAQSGVVVVAAKDKDARDLIQEMKIDDR